MFDKKIIAVVLAVMLWVGAVVYVKLNEEAPYEAWRLRANNYELARKVCVAAKNAVNRERFGTRFDTVNRSVARKEIERWGVPTDNSNSLEFVDTKQCHVLLHSMVLTLEIKNK